MAPTRNPTSWDEYEGRASPVGSLRSNVIDEEEPFLDGDADWISGPIPRQERRRSSVTNRLAAMADIGGVNSIRSFARSWQRAAAFAEVIPRRHSFVLAADSDPAAEQSGEDIQYGRSHVNASRPPLSGLLRQHLEASPPSATADGTPGSPPTISVGSAAGEVPPRDGFREREQKASDVESVPGTFPAASTSSRSNLFSVPPHLATPSVIGSYGSQYGTMGSVNRHRSRSSASYNSHHWGFRDSGREIDPAHLTHGEEHPILVKEVQQGDRVVLTVEGQSTLPQSIFNSINAIIGVGLLSLPLALKMSGWIIGLVILTLCAAVTAHTGKLLGRCMHFDPSIITYSDLAYVAFGSRARIIVSALFTLELVAACVALVILFADSLTSLLPNVASATFWKCICAALILVLNVLPLRWLSYTSIVGIFSTFCIVCIVIVDGFYKQHTPGSLWEPAKTYLLPSNWLSLPLAYGLMASPWGAHSVFPSIYRDMRHPHKWNQGVNVTFSFSYALDTSLAVVGILMFGDGIKEAITTNILEASGYPESLTIIMSIFITIIPLTKIPLNARPLITTADVVFGLHMDQQPPHHLSGSNAESSSTLLRNILRVLIRIVVVLVLLAISILFPAFDSVCAFLGAALCTLISVLLPICFYLKLYWKDIGKLELIVLYSLLITFTILGLVGTIWTFLPKHLVGA